eukprot:COSAG06_NODE_88_length_24864_cov_7.159368_10_plen_133_part_00
MASVATTAIISSVLCRFQPIQFALCQAAYTRRRYTRIENAFTVSHSPLLPPVATPAIMTATVVAAAADPMGLRRQCIVASHVLLLLRNELDEPLVIIQCIQLLSPCHDTTHDTMRRRVSYHAHTYVRARPHT